MDAVAMYRAERARRDARREQEARRVPLEPIDVTRRAYFRAYYLAHRTQKIAASNARWHRLQAQHRQALGL